MTSTTGAAPDTVTVSATVASPSATSIRRGEADGQPHLLALGRPKARQIKRDLIDPNR